MSRESLQNVSLAGHIEGNSGKVKKRLSYLNNLCKWIEANGVGWILTGQILLYATRDRISWIIMDAMKGKGIYKRKKLKEKALLYSR